MRFDVETGSGRRTIEVQRSGKSWHVTANGRVMWVDLTYAAGRWSMLVHDPASSPSAGPSKTLGGRSHEVALDPSTDRKYLVYVDGRAVPVTLLQANSRRSRRGATVAAGPATVVAPMPGRVVRVLVKPGDTVAARQALVVVEAMKMENELRSPRAGTVVEVRAREGAPVDANVVLVVVE